MRVSLLTRALLTLQDSVLQVLRVARLEERWKPGCLASRDGNSIRLEFGQKVRWDGPLDLLIRAWVNGKPFISSGMDRSNVSERNTAGHREVTEAHFELPIDPLKLEAKPGDRLSIQFVYCPHLWDVAGDKPRDCNSGDGFDELSLPLFSNVVSWTMP